MGTMASQITSLTIVYSIVYSYSGTDQKKHRIKALRHWPSGGGGDSPVTGEFPAQRANKA